MTKTKKLNTPSVVKTGGREREILRAAVKLFSEQGFHQTKIDDIASEANVSKGLIYLYFKDKHDVLFHALRHVLERYQIEASAQNVADGCPITGLRQTLAAYLRMISNHRNETLLAYRSTKDLRPDDRQKVKVLETRAFRVFRRYLEASIHQGLYKPVDIDTMTQQFLMFCHGWALKYWALKDRYEIEEYHREGEKILIDAFLTEAGWTKTRENQ